MIITKIEGEDIQYFKSQVHQIYLIDGERVTLKHGEKAPINNADDIRIITETKIVSHYTSDGEDKMSVNEYNETIIEFNKSCNVDDDGYSEWEDIENEYNYKKFKLLWKPVYKHLETISEPITVEYRYRVIDSGNPFIVPEFVNGKDSDLFLYDRELALINIVADKMNSLGMEFVQGLSYEKTDGKKQWGNSTHSGIRYVTAFGHYLFTDRYKNIHSIRGKLDVLKKKYDEDLHSINKRIESRFRVHFGSVNEVGFDFEKLLKKLNHCTNAVQQIDYKRKSESSYFAARKLIRQVVELVEDSFEVIK